MTLGITRSCCGNGSCVPTCPINYIYPAPAEPGYATTETLHIDPETCIECSGCVQVCPVDGTVPDEDLTLRTLPDPAMTAAFHEQNPLDSFGRLTSGLTIPAHALAGRCVAIVGHTGRGRAVRRGRRD